MPEGDTIFRSAATLRSWVGGRVVTAARCALPEIDVRPLVGRTVVSVTPVGKHLLMQFDHPKATNLPLLLRTRMTGSWHVYPSGARWQRPARQAKLVIETGDRLAVCFNVPVVELTTETVDTAQAVAHLGPDVLDPSFDPRATAQRVVAGSLGRPIGELLLDQRLVAGIGNIYRCEALFAERVNPWTGIAPGSVADAAGVGAIGIETVGALLERASSLMRRNLDPSRVARDLDAGPAATWVYRRSGLPCKVCGATIRSLPQGEQGRVAYWCPQCQPRSRAEPVVATLTP
jgi:endonuclease VIII